jgi:uncharacterized membrane protein YkvA (DUF1232 family)
MTERVVIELSARERRLYDRLRASVVRSEPGEPSTLRDMMLLVPDLAVLLVRLVRDSRVPPGSKAIALLGVAYLVSPIDLVPDLLLGPIGLVDDLLVLAACLSRLVNYVHPDIVRSHWSGQGDALETVQRLSDWSEDMLTARLPRAFLRAIGLRTG